MYHFQDKLGPTAPNENFQEDHQFHFYVPLAPFHFANLTHKEYHQYD